MFKIIKPYLKRLLSVGIPVRGPVKSIFSFIYGMHILIREGFIFLMRFIYGEPLFRSQCEDVGAGLWMEKLPDIQGRGRIVIGKNVRISGKPTIAFSRHLQSQPEFIVGDGTFIAHNTVFAIAQSIRIGKNCLVAGGTTIIDNDGHPLDPDRRRRKDKLLIEEIQPVVIGDDVWLGGSAVVLKGVTIGDRAVVASRAVVTKDVAPDTVVAGNPARVVKELGK